MKARLRHLLEVLCLLSAATLRAEQLALPCVERMPDIPAPYRMRDWKAVALTFDALAFDTRARGEWLPLVHLYTHRGAPAFALPPYVGPTKPVTSLNEGITAMGAVLGASLAGIDKRKGPVDWVRACQQFYNPDQRLVLNRIGGKPGRSYWYDVFPHILFAALADLYPDADADAITRAGATRWREACRALTPPQGEIDFEHQAFDFVSMKPAFGKWREPDAAAGIGWIEYMAWVKTGDTNFLRAAAACIGALNTRTNNPYYEVQLPFGAYTAARLNAELGKAYDVRKLVRWCFDHDSVARPDMGVITERWQDLELSGLYGSVNRPPGRSPPGGYAFVMNTYAMMWPLVPIARYDARFARALGKWMLNAAAAARHFYADATPAERQSCAGWAGDPEAVVAYEGIRYRWHRDEGERVIVGGDAMREKWPFETDYCLYGSGLVGVLGALVRTTEVEGVLRLDCLATDFYRPVAWPTYLYYNPRPAAARVTCPAQPGPLALYDAVTHRFLARSARAPAAFEIPGGGAVVLVVCPENGVFRSGGGRATCDGRVIDYAFPAR